MSGPYKEFMVTVKERPVWGPDLAQGERDATGDETGSEGDSEDEEFEDDEDDDWENSARAAKDRMYAEEEEEGIQYVPRKQPQF
ncbi:hypothetical protein BT96DRAFT_912794 [Gymnopus androsaceus JB14]|uniref:Uncharacterized protein n=1 Tax=Gymnopus androsaceus JB14 TaxID=1447944 RepID=A0A6A4IGP6_9AGAR|nr:hypothetical protein BT96DRAFT_912794 [Gymnopus androsaceus JB14]